MNIAFTPVRFRAVSMEFAAYLDDQYVEMHIFTDMGKSIAIICEKNSIISMQRHIKQMVLACPEIKTWIGPDMGDNFQDNAAGS